MSNPKYTLEQKRELKEARKKNKNKNIDRRIHALQLHAEGLSREPKSLHFPISAFCPIRLAFLHNGGAKNLRKKIQRRFFLRREIARY